MGFWSICEAATSETKGSYQSTSLGATPPGSGRSSGQQLEAGRHETPALDLTRDACFSNGFADAVPRMGVTQGVSRYAVHEIAVPMHANGQIAIIPLQPELALPAGSLNNRGLLQHDARPGGATSQKQGDE